MQKNIFAILAASPADARHSGRSCYNDRWVIHCASLLETAFEQVYALVAQLHIGKMHLRLLANSGNNCDRTNIRVDTIPGSTYNIV